MRPLIVLIAALALAACSAQGLLESAPKAPGGVAWNLYYARTDIPRRYVQVQGPTGTTKPMAALVADEAARGLRKAGIDAGTEPGGAGRHFVLSGELRRNTEDARVRYQLVLHWLLTDDLGRVIGSHVQGIEGTHEAWIMGDPKLIRAAGAGAAVPVADMVRAETGKPMPADPLRQGLLVREVSGLGSRDSAALTGAIMDALRAHDVLVTQDTRQAVFALQGSVERTAEPGGMELVRITWRILTLDGANIGYAVQEKQVPQGSLEGRWGAIAPSVAVSAADGIERIFGPRQGPAGGYQTGAPPEAPVLPQVPGRAPPPPPG